MKLLILVLTSQTTYQLAARWPCHLLSVRRWFATQQEVGK